eukprot:305073-Pleurochrysis_carterae.AAC.3
MDARADKLLDRQAHVSSAHTNDYTQAERSILPTKLVAEQGDISEEGFSSTTVGQFHTAFCMYSTRTVFVYCRVGCGTSGHGELCTDLPAAERVPREHELVVESPEAPHACTASPPRCARCTPYRRARPPPPASCRTTGARPDAVAAS